MRKAVAFLLALALGVAAAVIYALIVDAPLSEAWISGLISAAVALLTYMATPSVMANRAAANRREDLRRDVAREVREDDVR